MTTAKTRRSGKTAGAREETTAKPADKANEAIPVLIRLPRLAVEPEPSEASYAAEDEAGIRATIPLQARATDLEPSLPVRGDARKTIDATAGGIPPGAASQMPSPAPRTSPWFAFRVPRWAIHAGIALGLIAVLMMAFWAIRGPAKNSDNVAEFAPMDTLPIPGIPASKTPALPSPTSPVPLTGPISPTSPMAAASHARANGVPGMAHEERASAEKFPTSFAVPKPADAKYAPAAASPQAPLPPLPESPASKMDAAPVVPASASPAPAGPPATAERKAAETASAEAYLPLTSGPTVTDPSTPADLYGYPETNPTTFQYPVDYHRRLQSQIRAPAREINETGIGGPLFNGTAANGCQPNTARLQPRIEPPPVR